DCDQQGDNPDDDQQLDQREPRPARCACGHGRGGVVAGGVGDMMYHGQAPVVDSPITSNGSTRSLLSGSAGGSFSMCACSSPRSFSAYSWGRRSTVVRLTGEKKEVGICPQPAMAMSRPTFRPCAWASR